MEKDAAPFFLFGRQGVRKSNCKDGLGETEASRRHGSSAEGATPRGGF